MHRRSFIVSGLAVSLTGLNARSETLEIVRFVPGARKVGTGRFSQLGFDIFDATLYAPAGRFSETAPFALKLEYLRNVKGKTITDSSEKEIQKQGISGTKLEMWRDQMAAIFPNVSKGSSITGLRDQNGHALFYSAGKQIGAIKDPEFTRAFFNIWLGPKSQSQALRQRLLGS